MKMIIFFKKINKKWLANKDGDTYLCGLNELKWVYHRKNSLGLFITFQPFFRASLYLEPYLNSTHSMDSYIPIRPS
jgi:hypothetical protein